MLEGEKVLYEHADMKAQTWEIKVLPRVLMECIKKRSNEPYWAGQTTRGYYGLGIDLRHPKLAAECRAVFAQFGLNEEDFIKKDIQK